MNGQIKLFCFHGLSQAM